MDESYEPNIEQTDYTETGYHDIEYQGDGGQVDEGQQETEAQEYQQNHKHQKTTAKKRESSFCLNLEFGKCGGKISCKGMRSVM